MADCPHDAMELCQEWFMEQLDADPAKAWAHIFDYWFWGLMTVAMMTPFWFFLLPFNILITIIAPEFSIPSVGQPKEELTWMMWFNLSASRTYLPYNAFFGWLNSLLMFQDHEMKFTDYNIRYLDASTVVGHLFVDWLMLVPIELQAIVMFFVTLPAWPWAMTSMRENYDSAEETTEEVSINI